MKNLLLLLFLVFSFLHFSMVLNAQKVNVDVKKTLTPPVIDAQTDLIWNAVEPVYLEKNMTRDTEEPTVTAFWKALYDDEYIYLLINVEDDEHLPSWETGGNHWEYDKPEVYFDVNNVLNDGLGTSITGTGHFQYAPPFEELNYSIPHFINYMNLEVFWCYELDGSNYQVEYAFPYALMPQGDGTTLDVNGFKNLPENIGFDVTIVDRDSGDQARKRKVWQHNGIIADEAWNSMDECGTINLVDDIATNKNNAFVQKTTLAPQIDGQVDALWNDVDTNKIEKNYINETPTVDAFWKATWADSGLFVLVSVTDDNHYPSWKSGGYLWEYDWVNVFFDVNQNLIDGGGTGSGLGHLETYFNIEELKYGIPYLNVIPSLNTTGGNYAYTLNGDIFTMEMFIPFENLTDDIGTTMTKQSMLSRTAIGFDVNITDQDEGITSLRQRKVWQNDGSGCGEAWACMDDCGTIVLDGEPLINVSEQTIAFDEIYIGNTQNKSFTIGNLAYEPLSITSITSNNENFIVSFSPITLNRNKSTVVNVSFSPTTPGNTEGLLTIFSNAGDTTITVTGSAQNSPIDFEFSPTSFNVSSFSCSDSVSQQLTINNTGNEELQYSIATTHPNSNTPGEVLETINGFLRYSNGLILTDTLIYAIDYNWLYVYDFSTMSLLNTYQIHYDAWGLATDGQYLYIGQYGGVVYKYDFSGNLIGQLTSLSISSYPSLAFDGEHLIVADNNNYNPAIYKCDLNGNIVSTFISTFNGYLRNIAWNSEHIDGQLWAVDPSYGVIRQLRFEGNQLIHVNLFSYPLSWDTSLAFYNNDLWYAGSGKLSRLHDGVEDSWLSTDQTAGTLAPGESTTVNVSFDAKKVNNGSYNASLLIISNDPVNPELSIPAQFTLDGEAQMELSATTLDFGEVFANGTKFDTLAISNPGCDTLFIDFTSSNENIFSAEPIQYVLPGKSANVLLSFSPEETITYNESLTLTSSLRQETIAVTGVGIPAPELALSPANIKEATTNCSDSLTQQLSISNPGAANLEFNITTEYPNINTPGEVLETINGFLQYPRGMILTDTLIYAINYNWLYVFDFNTMSLLNTYQIHYDAWGLATDGQYLYIGQYGGVVYKYDFSGNLIGELVSLPISDYPSLVFDGEHLIVANINNYNPTIYKCDLNGNIVSTFISTFNGYLRNIVWNSEHADGQLWAIDPNYGVIRQLRFEGNQLIHVNLFSYPLSWESSLAFYNNDLWYAGSGKLSRLHDGVEDSWLSTDQTAGTLAPGESTTVNVSFDAKKVNNGSYNASLLIISNDPVNPELSIPAQFTLDGEAQMELSATALDFGEVFLTDEATNNLVITNSGCDTLFLGNIQQPTGPFTVSANQNMLLPGEASLVTISFNPIEINSFYEEIYIPYQNSDTLITLQGNGIAAPAIELYPSTFEASLVSGDSITQNLTIQNNGASALSFEFPTGYGMVKTNSILIIQDKDAWGTILSDFIYNNFSLTPTVINSTQIAGSNFSNFDVIITAGDQSNEYYSAISANVDKFSDFVSKGGIVQYQLATQGSNVSIVGNVNVEYGYQESQNKALMPSHPLFNNIGATILDGYSANTCFLSSLPSNAQILTETVDFMKPTTVEYPFGKGLVIASGMLWEYLTNSGLNSAPLLYNAIAYTLSKIGGLPYWLELSTLSGNVPAGESLSIDVKFNAKEAYAGSYSSSIELTTNDPLHKTEILNFNLSVSGQPEITVPDSLIFDYAVIGKNSTEMLNITNSGTSVLTINDISCDNPMFVINTTSLSLEPKQNVNLEVSIIPVDNSIYLGNLTINSNAVTNPAISVGLKAEGITDTDSLALVALYNAAGGAGWNNNQNWLSGPLNTWYGVTIENGRVTGIYLSWNNLTGYLPDEIGDLTALTTLNLSGNWGLSNSTIPSSIGNLQNLKELNLNYCQLTGAIPESLWSLSNLEFLELSSNSLSGSIPASIGELIKLNTFNIGNNQITGVIPTEILSLPELNYLNLNYNDFTAAPMPDFSQLTKLQSLYIEGCNFTGSIPSSLLQMSNLRHLGISNNPFDAAPMPDFSQLSNLQTLVAYGCNFSGNLPQSLFSLTQLNYLNIQNNQLTGLIPSQFGNMINLSGLYLSNNQFTGEIPAEIGSLANLVYLSLANNQLSGSIPAEIGNCTNLYDLNLSYNQLSGELPAQLGQLTNLRNLYLYGNRYQHINLEAIMSWDNFSGFYNLNYSNQQNVGTEKTVMLPEGSSFVFEIDGYTPSPNDVYQWYKDESPIDGANQVSYTISNISTNEQGWYRCQINNTVTTALTLYSNPITLLVGSIGLVGSFNNWGAVPDVPFTHDNSNINRWYLDYVFNTGSDVKFRVNNSWDYNWGGNSFPADNMVPGGNNIPVPSGYSRIELDFENLTYRFTNPDSLALVALYNSTGGENWINKTNWLSGPLATWEGVTLENYRVVGLDLGWDNNLTGVLPDEIGDLTALQWIYISNNQNLTGTIPSSIGNLTNLQTLYLNNCGLTGTIPSEISGLYSLIDIDLSFNNFDPSPMPDFGAMSELRYMSLQACNLTGNIPAEIGDCTKLRSVNLANNNLSGEVPSTFSKLIYMTECLLNNNNLTGNLADLTKLARLKTLSVNENKLTFTGLASFDNQPVSLIGYTYAPQDTLLGIQLNENLLTALDCGHPGNVINWYRNGELVLTNSQTCEAAETGYYSFRVNNSGYADLTLYSDSVYVEIETIPVDLPVSDYLLPNGENDCMNALNDITVAGNSEVIIENNANATFIAGNSIRFLPGFHAQEGSFVDAHITTTGSFCDDLPAPIMAAEPVVEKSATEPIADENENQPSSLSASMKVYPNPNNGLFTVTFDNFDNETKVFVYNTFGQKVYQASTWEKFTVVELQHVRRGIYFVKAVNNQRHYEQKIIVQ